ncbi:ribosomal RNA-processing protein 7 homolog A isoform X2 [Folsomia candida]|uniref:Ribosomal RNA-processing protein 7 A n=1 Tax=Folsomia candida TaxID=158441 RepID=A0A226DAT1_FOLCA|nr:ribosomal RNA-processing protein 7 homolog A isoform X2 [Folsomia candida]OXA41721.1 Ribosomal RNA-processing protein 7 A [Folsomia candida]
MAKSKKKSGNEKKIDEETTSQESSSLSTRTTSEIGEISGFKVLRWKAKPESEVIREFFVKIHDVSEPTRRKPLGRTLLILNIPPFVYEKNIRQMFSAFGKIDEIFLHQKPTLSIPNQANKYFPSEKELVDGYKVAYVVFSDIRSVKELIQIKTNEIEPLLLNGEIHAGMRKWIDDYNSQIIDPAVLEEDVKQYMIEFEKQEIRRKAAEKQASEPDDEGWVTVTSQGKRAGTKRTESTQEKLKAKKRRMEKAVLNITPAQIKATKAKQLEELKKKFDEDKQKIALLKQQRKFKPF